MEAALQASAPRKQHQPRAAGTEAFMSQEMAHLPNDTPYTPTPHKHTHKHIPSLHCSTNMKKIIEFWEKICWVEILMIRRGFICCLSVLCCHTCCIIVLIFRETTYMTKSVSYVSNDCILSLVTLIRAHLSCTRAGNKT